MKTILTFIICFFLAKTLLAQSDSSQYYINKVNQLLDQEDYKGVMLTLNKAIERMPDSHIFYDMRGTILESFRFYEEAIQDFTKAIENAQDDRAKAYLLSNRGGTKSRIRDFEGAYQDLIRAVGYDSTNLNAYNNLATACNELGKTEESITYLNKVILINPAYMPAYINLGFIHQGLDKHEKAIKFFNKAIDLSPNEALAFSNRSFSRLKTNDLKGALEDINYSIQLMPTNSYAYKIRALIAIEEQNLEDACKDLSEALELGYTKQYGEEVNELRVKYCE